MKKTTLIAAGLMLALTFSGCTKGSSTLNAGNNTSEASSTTVETVTEKHTEQPSDEETTTENTTEKPTTEEPTTEAPSENSEDGYNAEEARRKFEEADIPDSIKSIFLSDGKFIDTRIVGGAVWNMSNFHFYIPSDEKSHKVIEWDSYITADLDGDGKKELLYTALLEGYEGGFTFVFYEHPDGSVYSYALDTNNIQVGYDGAVFVPDGTDDTAKTGALLRMKFNKEQIIETELARAEKKSGEIKYYIGGQEVDANKYDEYAKPLRSGTKWEKNIYNLTEIALQKFEESVPDSIKSIFLSDGQFIDTQTQKEMKLEDYKLYEIIYSDDEHSDGEAETYNFNDWIEVFEWQSYIAVDFDGDGKKELFYDVNNGMDGVIFREHTDGKVYAYRHKSLRVRVNENGDVFASGSMMSPDWLLRYSFDSEKIISTKIVYGKQQDDGEYKYYAEGREVEEDEFWAYFERFNEGGTLNWAEFSVVPDSKEK